MSWLSDIGHKVKQGVVGAGHFLGDVATNPIVKGLGAGALALTGAGIPLSAAIMGGSGALGELIKPGGNLGKAASGGVKGAAIGTAAGAAGKALGALTGGKIGAGGGAAAGGSNWDKLGDVVKAAAPVVAGAGGGGGGGAVQSALDWITGNGGANALGVAQGLNALQLQQKSGEWADKAIHGLEGNYNDRARLRTAGIEGMLNPITPDLSGLLKNSGPYVQGLPKVAPTAQYTGIGNATQPGRVS